jgi:hypothetical protein
MAPRLEETARECAARNERIEAAAARHKHWLTAPECEPQREAAVAALALARASLERGIREALDRGCPPLRVAQTLGIALVAVHVHGDTPLSRRKDLASARRESR